MGDTPPDVQAMVDEAIRRQEPGERLRAALALSETIRGVALAGLRRSHPGLSDLQLVELMLGTTLIPRHAGES